MNGQAATVVQISDTHLSRRHGHFHGNWRLVADELTRHAPDLVVNSGDLSVNGADDDDDLDFAIAEHTRLRSPWVAVPGNHDIGEEPGNQHLGQPVDEHRLRRYQRLAGADRWSIDVADWRLLGLDSQLCGSGLPAEADQLAWLRFELADADRPLALFLHKPLFIDRPDEADVDTACLLPEARAQLLDLLIGSAVRVVACGHLHQARLIEWQGITMVWAPSTAFPGTSPLAGATNPLGWVVHRFDGPDHHAEIVEDHRLRRHDLDAIKGHGRYQFLYQTPPAPLPGELGPVEPGRLAGPGGR